MGNKKVLVVVDVQNDFDKGGVLSYGYPSESNTDAIISKVREFIDNGNLVFMTRDTHGEYYNETLEGKMLPVPHCRYGTHGWNLVPSLKIYEQRNWVHVVDKHTFGTSLIGGLLSTHIGNGETIEEIHLVGYMTSICVLANAVILRSVFPNTRIFVHKDLCGDVDEESHLAALKVMKNQQIEVI